jgi:hypothetical protein
LRLVLSEFDGYRIQTRVEDGQPVLRTRKGLNWTAKFGDRRISAYLRVVVHMRIEILATRRGRKHLGPSWLIDIFPISTI